MRLKLALAALALPFAMMPANATLTAGAKAPVFTAKGAVAGKPITVDLKAALKKGPVVLYFFPAAFTSGCNAEAHAFAEAVPDFRKAGATVIGMSADDVPTLQRFSSEKCAGKFAVASAGPAVIRNYDVALNAGGRALTKRTSYVIGKDGRIAFVHDDMNPAQHVALTLAAVRKLAHS